MRADTSQELQMVRALKFYSHSNFQVYNIVLKSIVTMPYIRSPDCIYFVTGSLDPLTNI